MKLTRRILAAALSLVTAFSVSAAALPQVSAAGTSVSASSSEKKLVSFTGTLYTLGKSETMTLTPILYNKQDTVSKWVTTDPAVVIVKDGVLTARKTGEATVKVRTSMGGLATCTVRVKAAPSSVKLGTDYICIGTGEKYQFRGTIPANSASADTVYTVDNPRIAVCNEKTGLVTGRKHGSTTLTVKTYNGKTDTCTVKVLNEPDSVELNYSKLTLGVGEALTLKAVLPEYTASNTKIFKSDNKSVVSCEQSGRITALSPGTAKITVKLYNGLSASCTVTVKKAPSSVRLNSQSIELEKGKKSMVYCLLDGDSASFSRTYTSSNTKVATVDKSGIITARSYGETTVRVTLFNGVYATCKVVVPEPEPPAADPKNYLDLQDDLAVLAVGETFTIRTEYQEGTLKYHSYDKSVATVSANGVVRAVGVGTTDIAVTSASGKTSRVAVIVTGDRYSTAFPDASETDALLNSEKVGAAMKTGCPDVDNLVTNILAKIIKPGMTNAQKVRACYEYLAKTSTYGAPYGYPELTHNYKYSSDVFIICDGYALLKNHYGTCENFSCALTILLRRLGYKADVVEGLTGMRSGGKGGHFWTDVTLGNKHYSFDAQIENNNLYGGEVLYYWYGTKPEHNFKTCEYQYLHRVHYFAYY